MADLQLSTRRSHEYTLMNFICFLLASFSAVALAVFVSTTQTFFITDVLQIGENVGSYVGTLGLFDEILSMCLVPLMGVLADRFGSRVIVSSGFFVSGLSLFGFGYFVRTNVVPQMLFWRLVFAAGLTASLGILTVMVIEMNHSGFDLKAYTSGFSNPLSLSDREQQESDAIGSCDVARDHENYLERVDNLNKSRKDGTKVSYMGIMSGFGAVFAVTLLLRLPVFYGKTRPAGSAMRYSYYTVGAGAIAVAVIMWFYSFKSESDIFFKDDLFESYTQDNRIRDDLDSDSDEEHFSSFIVRESYWTSLKTGFQLSMEDPGIVIAYLSGFISRCITIVITLYIPFYVNAYYREIGNCTKTSNNKVDCPESYILSSILTGVANLFGLLLAPISGILVDRLNNYTALISIAALFSTTGFLTFCLISTPDKSLMIYIAASLMGSAQIMFIIISMTMISNITSEDKYRQREGSISGVFAFVGGVGIIFTSFVGGKLADWSPKLPFLLVVVTSVVGLLAVMILNGHSLKSLCDFSEPSQRIEERQDAPNLLDYTSSQT
ncbi:hypothetical protein KL929_004014 [Ogataea haglerorum]|uniref:uncharacterized protein n=1 Tax=Ogataea haglerorum TaxID=1937702 RepID=UPI001C897361|nr:uncharacterized protein KL911_001327 [Ogataea haglerorum]KAG7694181.1 hypothetical protein KL951_004059 [Ogataea haglerorum]KAG7751355.1 hypothetical protein KL912_000488 [Ogataea haglerorum]KAG7756525.1 hypothetical protein KL911_001327 [Ogataea haglerorum]KAG7795663.1 hypothetical protein KL929_004014 [Ogataea haglerorum]